MRRVTEREARIMRNTLGVRNADTPDPRGRNWYATNPGADTWQAVQDLVGAGFMVRGRMGMTGDGHPLTYFHVTDAGKLALGYDLTCEGCGACDCAAKHTTDGALIAKLTGQLDAVGHRLDVPSDLRVDGEEVLRWLDRVLRANRERIAELERLVESARAESDRRLSMAAAVEEAHTVLSFEAGEAASRYEEKIARVLRILRAMRCGACARVVGSEYPSRVTPEGEEEPCASCSAARAMCRRSSTVERPLRKRGVEGSSPSGGSKIDPDEPYAAEADARNLRDRIGQLERAARKARDFLDYVERGKGHGLAVAAYSTLKSVLAAPQPPTWEEFVDAVVGWLVCGACGARIDNEGRAPCEQCAPIREGARNLRGARLL